MAAKSFRCKVVTPSAALADNNVSYASVPLHDGLMGFLPGRAPILAKLGVGELKLTIAEDGKGSGGDRSFVVAGGFAKMGDGVLTILAEQAFKGEEISLADAEAELQKAVSETPKDSTPAAADALRERRDLARAKVALAKSAKGI